MGVFDFDFKPRIDLVFSCNYFSALTALLSGFVKINRSLCLSLRSLCLCNPLASSNKILAFINKDCPSLIQQ